MIRIPTSSSTFSFGTKVAIFRSLVRGEFHFEPHSTVDQVRGWASIEKSGSPDKMPVLDRVGELTAILGGSHRTELTSETIQELYDRLLNWFLLGCNVLQRGERARALDGLGRAHVFLLQLARTRANALDHWLTPSRNMEQELSASDCQSFGDGTSDLSPGSLEIAYHNTWRWSQELVRDLARSWEVDQRADLAEEIHALSLLMVGALMPSDFTSAVLRSSSCRYSTCGSENREVYRRRPGSYRWPRRAVDANRRLSKPPNEPLHHIAMQIPRVNPVGLVEHPEGYEASVRAYSMRRRLTAAVVLGAFLAVSIVATVYSLGAYCLTTDAGMPFLFVP